MATGHGTELNSVPLAFLFPGQGSQYAGMGRELARTFPAAARVYARASEALGLDLAGLCFEGPVDRLTLTEYAQPAILATSLAASEALKPLGMNPVFVAGHSLGEYSATVWAGGLSLEEGVRLVRLRGEMMSGALPPSAGGMAAVLGLSPDEARDACREAGGSAQVANFNCPGQVVISGLREDLEKAAEAARRRGARKVMPLAVSGPFHSGLMRPVAERFGRELEAARIRDLTVPLVSNVDAEAHSAGADIASLLTRQMASAVRWEESMRHIIARGVTAAVEVGPGSVLAGLMKRIDPGVKVFGTDSPERIEELAAFLAGC